MRAGLRTLQKMKSLNGWQVLDQRTEKFCQQLRNGFQQAGVPLQVTSYSSLFWIHGIASQTIRTIDDIPQNQGSNFKGLFLKALDMGVYLAPNAYEVGFVSLAHTDAILEESAHTLLKAAKEVF
jgi:glutamate-1-semialdehyde 2,1-aminomutase